MKKGYQKQHRGGHFKPHPQNKILVPLRGSPPSFLYGSPPGGNSSRSFELKCFLSVNEVCSLMLHTISAIKGDESNKFGNSSNDQICVTNFFLILDYFTCSSAHL